MMQLHIEEIARNVAKRAHTVLLLDRAGWHIAAGLRWPKNITPILLPSRAPELNPVENIWQFLRANFLSNRVFETYDNIIGAACDAWNRLIAIPQTITSIGMRDCPCRSDVSAVGITQPFLKTPTANPAEAGHALTGRPIAPHSGEPRRFENVYDHGSSADSEG